MAARRESGKGSTTRAFGWGGGDTDPVLVEREREAIASGAQAHLDGRSLAAVASDWTARGLKTVAGVAFTAEAVAKVLGRARHAGLIEHKGVIVGRATDVEPILSEETYGALQALFASRRSGRPTTEKHLLSGIARCAECGQGMSGTRYAEGGTYDDGAPRRRYRCKACSTSIDARIAEEWARGAVIDRLSDPRHAAQVARRSAAVEKVDAKIKDAERTGVALADRLGRGEIPLDRYDAATKALDARLTTLRAERKALLAQGADRKARAQNASTVAARWDSGTTEDRRAMLATALPLGFTVARATRRGGVVDASRLSVRE